MSLFSPLGTGPTHLAAPARHGLRAPPFAQGIYEHEAAAALLIGCSLPSRWRVRVGVPDLNHYAMFLSQEPQVNRRQAHVDMSRQLSSGQYRIRDQLACHQLDGLSEHPEAPLMQHSRGMQPGTARRGRQGCQH